MQDQDLFAAASRRDRRGEPLAERQRPRALAEVAGQAHLLGDGGVLARLLAAGGRLPSLILWGPPGCGKTTLARLLAAHSGDVFVALSALDGGVRELREAAATARRQRDQGRRGTLLFIDEIHRLGRPQQDALLPHVETGLFCLVGATTDSPAAVVGRALLSRCRVLPLRPLAEADIVAILARALADPGADLGGVGAAEDVLVAVARAACGDARQALGILEAAARLAAGRGARALAMAEVAAAVQRPLPPHDPSGAGHHDTTSALIKSMRASDPDAALFYLARMLEGAEDPRFILRRLIVFASEDVGHADPQALAVAVAADAALAAVGPPEGLYALVQAVTHLACAPKSDSVARARDAAQALARAHPELPPPLHLRRAHSALAGAPSHPRHYASPHRAPGHFAASVSLPDGLADEILFAPGEVGAEAPLAARLEAWRRARLAVRRGAAGGPRGPADRPGGAPGPPPPASG